MHILNKMLDFHFKKIEDSDVSTNISGSVIVFASLESKLSKAVTRSKKFSSFGIKKFLTFLYCFTCHSHMQLQ